MKVDVEIDIEDVFGNLDKDKQVKLVESFLEWDDIWTAKEVLKHVDESVLVEFISNDTIFEEAANRTGLGQVLK